MATSLEDRDLLREAVRDALAQLSTSGDVRRAMATPDGYEPRTWRRLAGELGLPGLAVGEDHGGAGQTAVELGIAFEEAGASLLCSPLFATAGLAVPLLVALGDEAALARYAPPIAGGGLTATVARGSGGGTAAKARSENEWVLEGTAGFVVDGASAGLILVVADAGGAPGVFAIAPDAPGLERERLVTLDQTRKQARLTFRDVPAGRIGPPDASAAIAKATAVSRALLASEQAGGAQHCLEATVAYARDRIQFARPIGSFQAVKQRLAELLILTESAKSAARAAAAAAADDDPELEHISAIASLTCGDAYKEVTAQAVQLHGGIGFTWEHDAHLYFKRARTSASLLGTAARLTDEIAAGL
ncbi:MAG: acyl-CoA/acyl-ACP dehydrogenase [Streptosporangiales bacterium]|nr:acyl-CoA/acyl-ACP dehydrogenase [Streptosporangiales bacterium]